MTLKRSATVTEVVQLLPEMGLRLFVGEHGAELEDPDGLLEGTGKSMRHVKISLDDTPLPPGALQLLTQAADL